jgi:predicted metal-binding protein
MPQRTREVINAHTRALLIHGRVDPVTTRIAAQLEREIFLSAFHKALAFGAGSCRLCRPDPCTLERCLHPREARPSMEACGIDMYITAHANGFPIYVLPDHSCEGNTYGLVLID